MIEDSGSNKADYNKLFKKFFNYDLQGWQIRVAKENFPLNPNTRILIKNVRGGRKSTFCDLTVLLYMLTEEEKFTIISSVSGAQSLEHISNIKKLMRDMGILEDYVDHSKREKVDQFTLVNGCRLLSIPQSHQQVGKHPDFLYIDELSRIEDKFFFETLHPMCRGRESSTIEIISSSPYGLTGVFSDIFHHQRDIYKVYDFYTEDCPWISQETIARERQLYEGREAIFQQEILGMFVNPDTFGVFPQEKLMSKTGLLDGDTSNKFIMGVDLGKKHSRSAVIILDSNGIIRHVSSFRWPWDKQMEELYEIFNKWKPETMIIDSTGLGDVFVDMIPSPLREFTTPMILTSKSKSDMVHNLRTLLQFDVVRFPTEVANIDVVIKELRNYVYTSMGQYSNSTGAVAGYDDLVCALYLAAHGKINIMDEKSCAIDEFGQIDLDIEESKVENVVGIMNAYRSDSA